MGCIGGNPKSGRRKGEIKVHINLNADEIVPSLVWYSEAKTHYNNFLEKIECDENTIYILDKGYNDYKAYEHFTIQKTGLVIRIKVNASHLSIEKLDIGE